MPLISAHRGGAAESRVPENSAAALQDSVRGPGELVEFDLQRCADGTLVLNHDSAVPGSDGRLLLIADQRWEALQELSASPLVTYSEALHLLAANGKRAHIDIKFSGYPESERLLAQQALQALGPEGLVLTSLEDDTVSNLRRWAEDIGYPQILVGLALGRWAGDLPWPAKLSLRRSELFPEKRLASCRANLLVANKTLARLRLGRLAASSGLPLLVWTVDHPEELRAWLADQRLWALTTNYPRCAARLRQERFVT